MNLTVSPSPLVRNLRAVIELICAYPSHTVLTACDRLALDPAPVPGDLLDLQGADAVDALEAEIQALSWKVAA